MPSITIEAPINIAVIKYWGKSNETLMLPCNDSVSITIESPDLYTRTRIEFDPSFEEDTFILNGHPEVTLNSRIKAVIREARNLAASIPESNGFYACKLRIESTNTVPTASGLASSASGIAALAYALIKLYRLEEFYSLSKLSTIARLGSGSACRSLFGGLVHWHGNTVEQVAQEWSELNGIVLVLNPERKKIPSTEGMQETVRTSSLFQHRINAVVPERIKTILKAINERDFSTFAELAMKDSNSFHACCLDTFPPISYLTPESLEIISAVHEYNAEVKRIAVGYTFDAGPNAVIFGLNQDPKNFLKRYENEPFLTKTTQIIEWKLSRQGPKIIHQD